MYNVCSVCVCCMSVCIFVWLYTLCRCWPILKQKKAEIERHFESIWKNAVSRFFRNEQWMFSLISLDLFWHPQLFSWPRRPTLSMKWFEFQNYTTALSAISGPPRAVAAFPHPFQYTFLKHTHFELDVRASLCYWSFCLLWLSWLVSIDQEGSGCYSCELRGCFWKTSLGARCNSRHFDLKTELQSVTEAKTKELLLCHHMA